MYLLIPGLLLLVAWVFDSLTLVFWAFVLMSVLDWSGPVFFRIIITLPLVQTVFALRRRDLTRAQLAVPCTVNIVATLLWWSYVLFPFD